MALLARVLAVAGPIVLIALVAGLAHHETSGARGLNSWQGEVSFPLPESVSLSAGFDPQDIAPISAPEARLQNDLAPLSTELIEPAAPYFLSVASESVQGIGASLDCLTAAIYYEAATEPASGKRAVAQVILNRARHPAFPNSICGVVFEGSERTTGCQFTFTCDGSLLRPPTPRGWSLARQIAVGALSGGIEPLVGMSTHYHADYVRPNWASSLDKVAQIGAHIFYRWRGPWGLRRAFRESVQLQAVADLPGGQRWGVLEGAIENSVPFRAGPADELLQQAVPELSVERAAALAAAPQFQPVPELRADRARGALLADENRGTLIAD